MKTIIYFLFFSIILSFCSCEKDPLEACKDDPNCEYFRCKVDGKEWRPNCEGNGGLGCSAFSLQYSKGIMASELIASNKNQRQSIQLVTRNIILKVGNNNLFFNDKIPTEFVDGSLFPCNIFPIDTSLENSYQIIKLDTISRIIEAKFNFTAQNDCGKRVVISDGEFRIRYTF